MATNARLRSRERQEWQIRKDKFVLFLLVLLMLIAVAFGLCLASKGLHPKKLHRRPISYLHRTIIQEGHRQPRWFRALTFERDYARH